MKRLLKNGTVVNVFTDELINANVLIDGERIIGVGDYSDADADIVEDVSGKYICPGLIDGHIHIESTMLTPCELSKLCAINGTTSIIADPHEIANVCGADGIKYMLEASEGLPVSVYVVLPSCVPASGFDESGAILEAEDLRELYAHPRVVGLGEMMNYPGVLFGDEKVMSKISDGLKLCGLVNGHAPLLSGKALDKYISAGIYDDHECSSVDEAKERIRKGQAVMIRRGSAARNLADLLPLFDEPWNRRCMLVTDDYHPHDLLTKGHINSIIREAVESGRSALVGIRMSSLQAARHFGLDGVGAIAPGYIADIAVFDDLKELKAFAVYKAGKKVVEDYNVLDFTAPLVSSEISRSVLGSFKLNELTEDSFTVKPQGSRCRVIKVSAGTLLTDELDTELDFSKDNGIDVSRDILKLAVVERYGNSGNIGLGYINGIGLKKGAIASSVSHDSHNLIVVGASTEDMVIAANRINQLGGGCIVVADGEIICEMPLPIGGLMTDAVATVAAKQNHNLDLAVAELGVAEGINPFMNMSFVALPVIPHLKMTTLGLVDVDNQKKLPLFLD